MLRIFKAFIQTEDRLKVRMAAPTLSPTFLAAAPAMQHQPSPAMQLSRRNRSGDLRVRLHDACRGEIPRFRASSIFAVVAGFPRGFQPPYPEANPWDSQVVFAGSYAMGIKLMYQAI